MAPKATAAKVGRIDRDSITAIQTDDPAVFRVEFDFTDDPETTADHLCAFRHGSFLWNTNLKDAEFETRAQAAMKEARRSSAAETLEASLRSKFGQAFQRVDPTPPAKPAPMEVIIVTKEGS